MREENMKTHNAVLYYPPVYFTAPNFEYNVRWWCSVAQWPVRNGNARKWKVKLAFSSERCGLWWRLVFIYTFSKKKMLKRQVWKKIVFEIYFVFHIVHHWTDYYIPTIYCVIFLFFCFTHERPLICLEPRTWVVVWMCVCVYVCVVGRMLVKKTVKTYFAATFWPAALLTQWQPWG